MAKDSLTAVILTALPDEFKEVRKFVTCCRRVKHSLGNVYEEGLFTADDGRKWKVGIVQTGAGDYKSVLHTERAVSHFNPDVVLFVGVAGGLKDVAIGDVVASTKVYGYESGKAEREFKPRPGIGLSGFSFIEEARAEERSESPAWLNRLPGLPEPAPKLRVGPIAVGEKVVASKESDVYKFLCKNYSDAIAVEMEGYGFLEAVNSRDTPLPAIVVRGISDLIDDKNDETHQEPEAIRQQKAARHASALAFQLLASYDPYQSIIGATIQPHQVETQFWDELFNCFQTSDLDLLKAALDSVLMSSNQDYAVGEIRTLSDLKAVFVKIDDKARAVTWVSHLVRKDRQNLDEVADLTMTPQLKAWCDANQIADQELSSPPVSAEYLLISLDPKDDAGTVEFMAELHRSDGQVQTDLVPTGTQCSLEEPEEMLLELLSKTIKKAKRVKTIEIFLSWQHLHKPIHEWKATAGLVPEPLRNFRGTLVRSLDRVTLDFAEEWCETLEMQLDSLQSCQNADLACRRHEVTTLDCDELIDALEKDDPSYLILKLLMVLPEDPQELGQMINALLRSGIPLWFWSYRSPTDVLALSKLIDDLLTMENLSDAATLSEAVRKKRKHLPDLGLLFECHTRTPLLPTVGESERLRQPAA